MRIHAALVLPALLLSAGLGARPAAGEPAAVGVVTTLQGSALVTRTALARPLRLAFRDNVFPRDRISTGEGALVRVLLDGKAVVTVRELSVLTLSERPGHAVVALESGAVTASIAHDRLRHSEGFEIRTRNAVAAVRGTILTVEAGEASAEAAAGPPVPLTRILVHRGQVEVAAIGDPSLATVVVGSRQQVSVSGRTLGAIEPTPAQSAGQSAAPQHRAPPELFVDALAERESARAIGLAHVLLRGADEASSHAGGDQGSGGREAAADSDEGPAREGLLRADKALAALGRADAAGSNGRGQGNGSLPQVPLTAISRGQHGRGQR
jgi:hypothetical protein